MGLAEAGLECPPDVCFEKGHMVERLCDPKDEYKIKKGFGSKVKASDVRKDPKQVKKEKKAKKKAKKAKKDKKGKKSTEGGSTDQQAQSRDAGTPWYLSIGILPRGVADLLLIILTIYMGVMTFKSMGEETDETEADQKDEDGVNVKLQCLLFWVVWFATNLAGFLIWWLPFWLEIKLAALVCIVKFDIFEKVWDKLPAAFRDALVGSQERFYGILNVLVSKLKDMNEKAAGQPKTFKKGKGKPPSTKKNK